MSKNLHDLMRTGMGTDPKTFSEHSDLLFGESLDGLLQMVESYTTRITDLYGKQNQIRNSRVTDTVKDQNMMAIEGEITRLQTLTFQALSKINDMRLSQEKAIQTRQIHERAVAGDGADNFDADKLISAMSARLNGVTGFQYFNRVIGRYIPDECQTPFANPEKIHEAILNDLGYGDISKYLRPGETIQDYMKCSDIVPRTLEYIKNASSTKKTVEEVETLPNEDRDYVRNLQYAAAESAEAEKPYMYSDDYVFMYSLSHQKAFVTNGDGEIVQTISPFQAKFIQSNTGEIIAVQNLLTKTPYGVTD